MLSKVTVSELLVFVVSLPLPQAAEWEWKIRPLAFFAPSVELSDRDLERLRSGRVFVDTIGSAGQELAVFAAGSLDITPDLFVSRVQDIVALRQSRFVWAIERFSNPPTLADLAGLTLGEQDLEDLVGCRPGDCGLETRRLGDSTTECGAGRRRIEPSDRHTKCISRDPPRKGTDVSLRRARRSAAVSGQELDLGQAFDRLVRRSVYLERVPRFRTLLLGVRPDSVSANSFLYWAVDDFGLRPVTRVTHVVIVRPNTRETLKHIGELVSDGFSILIFPEGRIFHQGEVLPFQPGVGMLASRLNVLWYRCV